MISVYCLLAGGQIFVALRWLIWFGERSLLETFCSEYAKEVLEVSKTSSFEIHWGYISCLYIRHDVCCLFGRTSKSVLVTKMWKLVCVKKSESWCWGAGQETEVKLNWDWGCGWWRKPGQGGKWRSCMGWEGRIQIHSSWEKKVRQKGEQTSLREWRKQVSHEIKAKRMEVRGLMERTYGAGWQRPGNRSREAGHSTGRATRCWV